MKTAGMLWMGLAVAVVVVLGSSCSVPDKVVVDYHDWVKDGASVSWKLEPGRYKVEMAATGDGVVVEFVGGGCPKSAEVTRYSIICDLPSTGQLLVTNPTVLGLGAASSVVLTATRLGS